MIDMFVSLSTPATVIDKVFNSDRIPLTNRYVTFVDEYQGDLLFRTFGYKTDSKGTHYTEVMRECPSNQNTIIKNMYLTSMSGWKVVYSPKTVRYAYYSPFSKEDFDVWEEAERPGITSLVLNPERITQCEKYKYSGYHPGPALNPVPYLRMYLSNPGVEFFGKLNIQPSNALISRCTKDGQFRRFVRDNAKEVGAYGYNATYYAFKNHMGINEASETLVRNASRSRALGEALQSNRTLFTPKEKQKICDYLDENNIGYWNYADYIRACVFLDLDIDDTKVYMPKDFQRMHDLRIDERASRLAEIAREKAFKEGRKLIALDRRFGEASQYFDKFTFSEGWYCLIIPDKISDLKREGECLRHCVGKMGYDVKMADRRSFIGFVRRVDDIEKPLVTVEFGMNEMKVLQAYGHHDSKPNEEIMNFVHTWENQVKKMLKKEAAA